MGADRWHRRCFHQYPHSAPSVGASSRLASRGAGARAVCLLRSGLCGRTVSNRQQPPSSRERKGRKVRFSMLWARVLVLTGRKQQLGRSRAESSGPADGAQRDRTSTDARVELMRVSHDGSFGTSLCRYKSSCMEKEIIVTSQPLG